MYEEVINYIRDKDNFSPTIFYDILAGEFMLDCHALKKVEKVMQKQGVNSIYDIDYSVLNLPDTLAVLYAIYLQANNLVCPSEMFKSGKLSLIADRLEELDVPPESGDFDDRMYYRLRNLMLMAMTSSAFTRHRLLVYGNNNELRFFNECKELNEVKIKLSTENFGETMKYLFAIEKRKWIKILEPEFSEKIVIYPGESAKSLFAET